MPTKLILSLCLIVFGWPLHVSSQSYHFKHFSVANGLPFVHVYAITQDASGHLWVGGYGGISKFDGISFKNYGRDDGLLSHFITGLTTTTTGQLYTATVRGINSWNGNSFDTVLEANNITGRINTIGFDINDNLWLGTEQGLFKHSTNGLVPIEDAKENITCIAFNKSRDSLWLGTPRGLHVLAIRYGTLTHIKGISKPVTAIAHDPINNRRLIGTKSGLFELSKTGVKRFGILDGLPSEKISSIHKKEPGLWWIGTDNGFAEMTNHNFTMHFVETVPNSNLIEVFYRDRVGNSWIGTYNGLYKFNSTQFLNYSFKDGMAGRFIYGIKRDQLGHLWIGSQNQGAFRYDGSNFYNYNYTHGLKGNGVLVFEEDEESVYMGTSNGMGIFNKKLRRIKSVAPPGMKRAKISALAFQGDRLWVGGKKLLFTYQDDEFKQVPFEIGEDYEIWDLAPDSAGRVWIGAYEGGLFHLDKTGQLTNLSDAWSADIRNALSLDFSSNHDLWIGTFQGVFHYDLQADKLTQIREVDGLNSDLVYFVKADTLRNHLWVGTNQGVNKLDLTAFYTNGEIDIQSFGQDDGFIGVECNGHGVHCDSNGQVWFGTVNGLIQYLGASAQHNTAPNQTFITGVKLFYQDTALASGTTLSYDQNQLTFSYKGICLTNPHKVNYQFMLEGYDKDWSPPSSERITTFSNLKPGDYRFLVRSQNNEGVWSSDYATFSFHIKTPYWQSWWFIVAVIGILSSISVWLYRRRIHNLEHQLELDRQVETLKLQSLRAQMNPHFIFNSMNSIQHFINSNEKRQANRFLSKFASLMRLTLDHSKQGLIKLGSDLQSIEVYMDLEQMRFEGKFTYSIEVDEQIDEDLVLVPPMLMQPFVENSIIHGFSKIDYQGLINIRITPENDTLQIVITDNGVGRSVAEERKASRKTSLHKSAALNISNERIHALAQMYKQNLTIEIKDLTNEHGPCGTAVHIRVPFLTKTQAYA